MILDYGTTFSRLGKLIKSGNAFLTLQSGALMGSSDGADAILDLYENRRDLVQNVQGTFQGFAANAASWIGALKSVADTTLLDLQAELFVPQKSLSLILPALVAAMKTDGQTVNASTVSTPTVTTGIYNVGTGQLLVSELGADGLVDERIISENITAVCIADQYTGTSAGGEQFQLTGQPAYPAGDGWHTRGRGTGPTLQPVNATNKLRNGDFETFSIADTPNNWTIVAGVVTTSIKQEQTNVHTGLSALCLHGNHIATTLTLTQSLSGIGLRPGTRMAAGAFVRNRGTFGAGASNLQIAVTGTGFATLNLFNADPATLTTAYSLKSGWFTVPSVIPADLKVIITWTTANAPDSGAEVLIDDTVVAVPTDFGHAQYALFRGAVDFVAGDCFAITQANNQGGVLQTFFGRFYDVKLPSNAAAGETIADSLCT